MKWSSLQKVYVNLCQKSFMKLTPGVNLKKLFWSKFTYSFRKLDYFRTIFVPKKFYEIDP